jgi:hypothetical protein
MHILLSLRHCVAEPIEALELAASGCQFELAVCTFV